MKREQLINHSCFCKSEPIKVQYDLSSTPSEVDEFLKLVYTTDDQGRIVGDLNFHMSDSASPAIKDFVARNILSQQHMQRVGVIPDGLTDADLENLSFNDDDTIDSYAQRVNNYISQLNAPKE